MEDEVTYVAENEMSKWRENLCHNGINSDDVLVPAAGSGVFKIHAVLISSFHVGVDNSKK